jgi:hypothetical protein
MDFRGRPFLFDILVKIPEFYWPVVLPFYWLANLPFYWLVDRPIKRQICWTKNFESDFAVLLAG